LNIGVENLALQTTILAVVLVSFAFRMKGNFKVHLVTIMSPSVLGVILATSAFGLSIGDTAYMNSLTSPTAHLATFASHALLGSVAIAFGLVTSALLLTDRAITTRSNLVAKITTTMWVINFAVGIWFFVLLHVV